MAREQVTWAVVQRMTLYGAGAGALLGLLYFWAAPIIGVLVGFAVGAAAGVIDGLLIASLLKSASRSNLRNSNYRILIAAVSSAIAAVLTLLAFFALVRGSESMLRWELVTLLIFVAIPVLYAAVAAWWAAASVMKWVRDQGE